MTTAFKTPEGRQAVLSYYENLMQKLSVPHERLGIQTRCGRTSLIAAGDPACPPLVLLHGSSMNAAMWIGDLPKYAAQYRVYAPDIPGEPGYSDERQPPFDTDDYSSWLLDVFDGLDIRQAALCGASLGGFLAVKFAVAHPERVGKLALMCPAGIGSQNKAFGEIAMRLLPLGEAGVDELMTRISAGAQIPAEILNYQKLIAFCFNARQEAIPAFTDEQLKRLGMPGIVFLGMKDILLRSDETAARVRALMPSFEVRELPELGHSLAFLGGEILAFLNR